MAQKRFNDPFQLDLFTSPSMSDLLTYGRMAETHWREHCPQMVRELEAQGQLPAALLEAQERTLTKWNR